LIYPLIYRPAQEWTCRGPPPLLLAFDSSIDSLRGDVSREQQEKR
jgi:hypothetical protein